MVAASEREKKTTTSKGLKCRHESEMSFGKKRRCCGSLQPPQVPARSRSEPPVEPGCRSGPVRSGGSALLGHKTLLSLVTRQPDLNLTAGPGRHVRDLRGPAQLGQPGFGSTGRARPTISSQQNQPARTAAAPRRSVRLQPPAQSRIRSRPNRAAARTTLPPLCLVFGGAAHGLTRIPQPPLQPAAPARIRGWSSSPPEATPRPGGAAVLSSRGGGGGRRRGGGGEVLLAPDARPADALLLRARNTALSS